MIRIAESDDFRDLLAAIIPEAVLLEQFLHLGVVFRLERNFEQHLLTDADGLLITERGFVGVASCLIWFHVDRLADDDFVVTLYDVRATRSPDEAEDDS